jgi:hypothetical protein
MSSSNLIAARVSPKTKARLIALARAQQLTESAFLRRFLESTFDVIAPAPAPVIDIPVSDLYAVLRACQALRDHFRKVILANLQSWETGRTEGEK